MDTSDCADYVNGSVYDRVKAERDRLRAEVERLKKEEIKLRESLAYCTGDKAGGPADLCVLAMRVSDGLRADLAEAAKVLRELHKFKFLHDYPGFMHSVWKPSRVLLARMEVK